MSNKRVYYPIKAVAISPVGTTSATVDHIVHGLQSVGSNVSFNLEQISEIGQAAIYENVEGVPNIEINLEKVLDGYCPIYLLATNNAPSATLIGRSNQKCQISIGIWSDLHESASGNPLTEALMSGAYITSVRYQVPVDGNATESVSLVCNNRIIKYNAFHATNPFPTNSDEPVSISSSGGVQRRQHIMFAHESGVNVYRPDESWTILPTDIPGISSSGTNDKVLDEYKAHINSFSVSCDMRREEINELGRKAAFFRYVNFPVEVTTEIGVHSSSGDLVSATEDGVFGNGNNLKNHRIRLRMKEGLIVDCGNRNKLQSVSQDGGNTDGGNESLTFTYSTFNDFTVRHPRDVTLSLR